MMTDYPGSSLNNLLIRQTALSVILQGLIDTLFLKGLLNREDMTSIKKYALDLSQDMMNSKSTEVFAAGIKIGEEVEAFLSVLNEISLDTGDA